MITNIWPYILRLALGIYFLSDHLPALLKGYKGVATGNSMFDCVTGYIPPIAAFTLWHGAFILLAGLIIFWPRPVAPLSVSLFILIAITYINFSDIKNVASAANLLALICILVNVALIIIYAKNRY